MAYDSREDTLDHIWSVQKKLNVFRKLLIDRGVSHDLSKLESPEKEMFDAATEKLRGLTYGSDEYKQALKDLGPALQHHYEHNSHHPEHYPNGIAGMSLLDIVEMFCDWKAATERHDNGNFEKSIQINTKRFKIDPQLAQIFENTRKELEW